MIEYILGGSIFIIFSMVGGYSKYKSYEYRQIANDDEIESWINENTMKRTSYNNILKRRSTRNTLSSKE